MATGERISPARAVLERSLLQRVAAGESEAVRLCIDRYGGLVWSLARKCLRSEADAEDAVQEIFIELCRSAGRFDPAVASEPTFVAMIARRRLIDRVRSGASRAGVSAQAPEADSAVAPASRPPGELGEEAAMAAAVLETLDPQQQSALRLALVQGLSHEQVARAMEQPLGTVKTNIRRGLIRIREMLSSATHAGAST